MSASWFARTAAVRSRTQGKLLLIVTAVAVLACSLVTTLGVLVTVTEQSAVQGALVDRTAEEIQSRLWVTRPEVPLDELGEKSRAAIVETFQGASGAAATSFVLSEQGSVVRPEERYAVSYLGELEEAAENVTLVDGEWPTAAGSNDGEIAVAVPRSALKPFHVKLGGTVEYLAEPGNTVTLRVVGVFEVDSARSDYWYPDLLKGESFDPNFPVPGSAGMIRTDAAGPLLVAPGELNAAAIPVERAVYRQVPSLQGVGVNELVPLIDRLDNASENMPTLVGALADSVTFSSGLQSVLGGVTTALSVTRSTIIVLSLLLMTVAIVALIHTSRLLNESREGERNLMRARGSSAKQLVALAAFEAGIIAIVAAIVAPLLARLIFLAVANSGAMRAGGMAVDPGFPLMALIVAPVVAFVFGFVLLLPMLKRADTFHEGEQARSRPRRASELQRSGIDIALFGIAAVAYWQLVTYKSPVADSATLSVDPVLVLGPTLIVLAGGLLGVRLVPAASRLFDRLAERSRGIVTALAAWEVGRRAERVTAAVLLLTIALAVGAFSQTFLATWKQSQIDQAAFAVGAPVRVNSETAEAAAEFARDSNLELTPVMRRDGVIAAPNTFVSSDGAPDGADATVLGLNGQARDMLTLGRVGSDGGTEIDRMLSSDPLDLGKYIELPGSVDGLTAEVQARSDRSLDQVSVLVRVVLENETGSLSNIDLGVVPIDGEPHRLRVELPEAEEKRDGLSIVGLQTLLFVDPSIDGDGNEQTPTEIGVRDIEVLERSGDEFVSSSVEVPAELDWDAIGDERIDEIGVFHSVPEGFDFGLRFTAPVAIASAPAQAMTMTWPQVASVTAVAGASLADTIDLDNNSEYSLILDGFSVRIFMRGETPFVPGGGSATSFDPLTLGEETVAAAASTMVVDQDELSRALVQEGFQGDTVDEWWADGAAQVSSPVDSPSTVSALVASDLGRSLQEHPLRAAVQGASGLVLLGAGILAAVGFAVHATGSLRSRSLEFAQLRAVGLSRRRLIGVVVVENLLLSVFGAIVGVTLGVLVGYMVSPLVGASPDGSDPVPGVDVVVPWSEIAILAVLVASVLLVVVLVAAISQRTAAPATLLRSGSDR